MNRRRRPSRSVRRPNTRAPDHLADQVRGGRGGPPARARSRGPLLRLGEDRADVGHQLDLEAVEDPRHPEADDDHPMEPRPRQPVQPCRYQAAHGLRRRCGCTDLGPLSCWLVGLACAAAACGAAAKTLRGTAVNLPSTTSAISGAPSVQFSFASTPYMTCASRYFSSGSLGAFLTGRMLDPAAASPHSRSRSTCGRSPWKSQPRRVLFVEASHGPAAAASVFGRTVSPDRDARIPNRGRSPRQLPCRSVHGGGSSRDRSPSRTIE